MYILHIYMYVNLTINTTLWVISADDKLMIFFLIFFYSQEISFDNLCKLSYCHDKVLITITADDTLKFLAL